MNNLQQKLNFMKSRIFLPVLVLLCTLSTSSVFAIKKYTPSTSSSVTGGGTFCQGATASLVRFTYNICNTGTGTRSGTSLTVKWYSNATNSTSGGTLVSTSTVTTTLGTTGSVTYRPSTAAGGPLYYYCVLTWTGAGTCNTSGSLTSASTALVTVKVPPTAITGPPRVCVAGTTSLSDASPLGTWSSLNTARATVGASTGIVTGVATGAVTLRYTTGCGTLASLAMTVYPAATPAITGTTNYCIGGTATLANTTPGGIWSSSNTAIASINSTSGLVTAVSAGTCTVSYTACGAPATTVLTVNAATAAITGTTAACVAGSTTLSDATAGGRWTSSNTAVATIGSITGTATGVAQGTATISYTLGTCFSTSTININSVPAAITGTNIICRTQTNTYTNTSTGGIWSSSNNAIVSIGSSSGIGTGVANGTATITYSNGCGAAAVKTVTVISTPANITGSTTLCTSSTSTLSDATSGGVWTSSSTSIATVGTGSGLVTGVSGGTATITYSVNTCSSFATVTINTPPAAITGTASVCSGNVSALSNTISGGIWSSSNTSVATVVIFSNRKYAILLAELANVGANPGRTALDMMDLGNPDLDWVKISEGMGVPAARAGDMSEFNDLFTQSNRQPGPFLIELAT